VVELFTTAPDPVAIDMSPDGTPGAGQSVDVAQTPTAKRITPEIPASGSGGTTVGARRAATAACPLSSSACRPGSATRPEAPSSSWTTARSRSPSPPCDAGSSTHSVQPAHPYHCWLRTGPELGSRDHRPPSWRRGALVVVASGGCLFFAERTGPGGLLPGSGMITCSSDHPAARWPATAGAAPPRLARAQWPRHPGWVRRPRCAASTRRVRPDA
jgi:hypothetical protein